MDVALPEVNDPQSLISAIKWAYEQGGWGCLAAFVVMIMIRVYRTDTVQSNPWLPIKAQWASLPQWAKWGLSFLGAGLTAGIPVLIAGQGVWAFVVAVLSVGAGAILGHRGTQKAGQIVWKSTGKDPNYQPSPVRKLTSLVVPVPKVTADGIQQPDKGSVTLDKHGVRNE